MEQEVEVLRVLRKPPLGKLVVETNQERYERLSEVTDGAVKQRILAAIGELIVFVDGYDTLVQAGLAPPIIGSDPSGKPFAPSMEEREAAFRTKLERQRDLALLREQEAGKASAAAEIEDEPTLSPESKMTLAEQIDFILQKHLDADPELQDKVVHIQSAPDGGLRILVNDTYFSQPNELEDGRVRKAIILAIREWESQK